jgi:hypothetical protein
MAKAVPDISKDDIDPAYADLLFISIILRGSSYLKFFLAGHDHKLTAI